MEEMQHEFHGADGNGLGALPALGLGDGDAILVEEAFITLPWLAAVKWAVHISSSFTL
jgi:hypothetical protein